MNNLPGRSSDAGSGTRNDCLTCGAKNWHTLGDCEKCSNRSCNICAIDTTKGLMCPHCIAQTVAEMPEEEWPEPATLEEVQAIVRYANIPEWLEPANGWVN